MSVSVFLMKEPDFTGDERPRLDIFDEPNEVLYFALEPVFRRIEQRCGLLIDLCGTVTFPADTLGLLREELQRAEGELCEEPDSWQVSVGTEISPVRRELVQDVARSAVLDTVKRLVDLIDEADDQRAYLVFSGD